MTMVKEADRKIAKEKTKKKKSYKNRQSLDELLALQKLELSKNKRSATKKWCERL